MISVVRVVPTVQHSMVYAISRKRILRSLGNGILSGRYHIGIVHAPNLGYKGQVEVQVDDADIELEAMSLMQAKVGKADITCHGSEYISFRRVSLHCHGQCQSHRFDIISKPPLLLSNTEQQFFLEPVYAELLHEREYLSELTIDLDLAAGD